MKKLISFCILLALLFPIQSLASSNKNDLSVDLAEAEGYAELFLNQNLSVGDWVKSNSLEYKLTFYDLNDEKLGYYFEINGFKGEDLGYIVVSASKDRSPVLQFGETRLIPNTSQLSEKYYYLSPGSYITATDYNDLVSKLNSEGIEVSNFIQLPRNTVNKEKWFDISSDDLLSVTSSNNSKLLSINRVHQRASGVDHPASSCGPATGAAIVNYWSDKGYNVKDSGYYGGDAELVNVLYDRMNSSFLGTSKSGWASGMETHLKDGNSTVWVTRTATSNSFGSLTYYIDDEIPVAIRFNNWFQQDYEFSYHYIVGHGYRVTNGTNYGAYKDPDGGRNNTGTHYFDWDLNRDAVSIQAAYPYSW